VRCFGTFTPDLESLVQWLLENRVDTVAMESTGVYWIPLFELLEANHIQAYLVNARHIQNVPGRKTDVLDCQSPKGRRSALAAKATSARLAQ
jgi:transposase